MLYEHPGIFLVLIFTHLLVLVLGVGVNLERIGRVARWKRAILEEGNTPPRPATASQQHARGNPSAELNAEIGAGDCTGVAVQLVAHACPREGLMEIETGAPCNWCGEVVQAELPPITRGGRS